jgi:hypothetical protein
MLQTWDWTHWTVKLNGSVTNFWAVTDNSSDNSFKTLKEKAKERIRNRKLPEATSLH